MGFFDRIARKLLGEDGYYDFEVSKMAADGCVGEEIIEKLRSLFKKEEPC